MMEADAFKPIVKAIRGHLEDKKSKVFEELKAYPQPVAGCDLHYQQLLEERDGIARELGRLDAGCGEGPGEDRVGAIEAFITSSKYICGDAEKKFLAALKAAVSGLKRSPA